MHARSSGPHADPPSPPTPSPDHDACRGCPEIPQVSQGHLILDPQGHASARQGPGTPQLQQGPGHELEAQAVCHLEACDTMQLLWVYTGWEGCGQQKSVGPPGGEYCYDVMGGGGGEIMQHSTMTYGEHGEGKDLEARNTMQPL